MRSRPGRLASTSSRLASAILVAVLLAGCSTVSSWLPFSSSSPSSTGDSAAAACPSAIVLRPLAQTAVFAPGAQAQPMGVAFYGVLSDVDVKCERIGNALKASVNAVIVGERGPAAGKATEVDLQYFIAVTGPNEEILSKRTLPVRIALAADVKRGGITDHVEEAIPLAGRTPDQLSLVLGFQQSPQALDFYRHFRGR